MKKEEVRHRIDAVGIVPAVRLRTAEEARFATQAVSNGGISIVEITMTVPGAIEIIAEIAKNNPEMVVGAGTLFDKETASKCLDAGAKFLTSPGLDLHLIEFALKKDVTVLAGALTPTEVTMAWKAGADFVKVYPCSLVGGGQVHSRVEGAVSPRAADCGWRRQSNDGGELHPCGGLGDWGRRGVGSRRGDPVAAGGAYSRVGAAVCGIRQQSAHADGFGEADAEEQVTRTSRWRLQSAPALSWKNAGSRRSEDHARHRRAVRQLRERARRRIQPRLVILAVRAVAKRSAFREISATPSCGLFRICAGYQTRRTYSISLR